MPVITSTDAIGVIREVVLFLISLRNAGKSYIELADTFQNMIPQINSILGNWEASRDFGNDGSIIFLGTVGHVLVIDKQGTIWKGVLEPSAVCGPGPGGVTLDSHGSLQPDYSILKKIG